MQEKTTSQATMPEIEKAPQPKSNTGLIVGMILCAVLGASGLSYGLYSNYVATKTVSDFKIEIKNDDDTTTPISEDKVEIEYDTKTITVNDDVALQNIVNSKDYVYIGDWGLKIKKPENPSLAHIDYYYSTEPAMSLEGNYSYGGSTVCFTGVVSYSQVANSYQDYARPDGTAWLYCISRAPESFEGTFASSSFGQKDRAFMNKDGYNYWEQTPQDFFSTDEDTVFVETQTVEIFKQMLSNPNN